MSHFVMGVSDDLVEECHAEMLHDSMDISQLMVHPHQVENSMFKMQNREFKREMPHERGTPTVKLDSN